MISIDTNLKCSTDAIRTALITKVYYRCVIEFKSLCFCTHTHTQTITRAVQKHYV